MQCLLKYLNHFQHQLQFKMFFNLKASKKKFKSLDLKKKEVSYFPSYA